MYDIGVWTNLVVFYGSYLSEMTDQPIWYPGQAGNDIDNVLPALQWIEMGWYGVVSITWSYLAWVSEPNIVSFTRPNQDSHILLMDRPENDVQTIKRYILERDV
jgi:hypothetical protein